MCKASRDCNCEGYCADGGQQTTNAPEKSEAFLWLT
nr:MAG TPA: hypothetical protein [Caudoviricetes sp.]